MKLSPRRVAGLSAAAVVVALTASALTSTAGAAQSSAPAASSTPAVVHACDQNVGVGQYACLALRRTDVGFTPKTAYKPQSTNPLSTPSGYGPTSLQSAYALPSASAGSGQRVYVVDAYDDPNAEADLATYRAQYGLPPCTTANGCFKKLNQAGTTSPLPSPNIGWAGEISLDLDMVSAICPNCGITLIEATNNANNLFTAVKEAATLGAKYVSMSWGGPETGSEASFDAAYFKPTGVVYTASTGDSGYQDGVEYPATSPSVVAVGGTSLTAAANSRGWNETVWKNSNSLATGSGCSSDETKPAWQSIISTTVCSRRAESDVSAVADPQTGVAVYQTYGGSGWAIYGGTSAAAPIIASVYALAGTPSSTDKPGSFPYAHTGNLNDVTSGNNGTCAQPLLCTAAAGWDGPTGLGTPNGVGAFSAAGGGGGGTNVVTVTNPGPRTGTVGTPTSLQISASDSGGATLSYSATGLPTGLSINPSTGLIGGTPSTAGTFSVTVTAQDTTAASGSATFSWTINAASSTGCSGQLLLNPGFESGGANWVTTAGVIKTDGAHPNSGVGYAKLDGYGTSHTDTVTQSVTIKAGCHATLTYYLWVSSNDTTLSQHDVFTVIVAGSIMQRFTNLNRGSGYVQRTLNLSPWAGRTVSIKFKGVENATLATTFYLDDTALTLS